MIKHYKKLIIDADPQYLALLRDKSRQIYGANDHTVFALYGPQGSVPEGVEHFPSISDAVGFIQDHAISAVLSGVKAPKAPEGARLYGFRMATELEGSNVHLLLHSNNFKQYQVTEEDRFHGIRPKDEQPEITLQILEGLAARGIATQKPKPRVVKPKLQRHEVNIMTFDAALKTIKPKFGNISYHWEEVRESADLREIARHASDFSNKINGIVLTASWEAADVALKKAEELSQCGCGCPVTLLIKDFGAAGKDKSARERAALDKQLKALEAKGEDLGCRVARFSDATYEVARMAQAATGLPKSPVFIDSISNVR